MHHRLLQKGPGFRCDRLELLDVGNGGSPTLTSRTSSLLTRHRQPDPTQTPRRLQHRAAWRLRRVVPQNGGPAVDRLLGDRDYAALDLASLQAQSSPTLQMGANQIARAGPLDDSNEDMSAARDGCGRGAPAQAGWRPWRGAGEER